MLCKSDKPSIIIIINIDGSIVHCHRVQSAAVIVQHSAAA